MENRNPPLTVPIGESLHLVAASRGQASEETRDREHRAIRRDRSEGESLEIPGNHHRIEAASTGVEAANVLPVAASEKAANVLLAAGSEKAAIDLLVAEVDLEKVVIDLLVADSEKAAILREGQDVHSEVEPPTGVGMTPQVGSAE